MRNPRQQNAERKRLPLVTVLHRQRPGWTPLTPPRQQRHRREEHESRQRHEPIKVCRRYGGAVPDGGAVHESFREVGPASKQQVRGHRRQKAHPAKVDLWLMGGNSRGSMVGAEHKCTRKALLYFFGGGVDGVDVGSGVRV